MIIIADNDIIHKLVLCDLLDELLDWLQVPPNEIWVLPTLKFWVRKKLKSNPVARAHFEHFLQVTAEIPAASPCNLARFDMLDVGEQQLVAVLVEQNDTSKLISGDKRALKQLAELTNRDALLLHKLNGNVDCLEGIMLELIRQFGFETINQKVSPEADGVFRLAFGIGKTEIDAIAALQSYLQDLRCNTPFVTSC